MRFFLWLVRATLDLISLALGGDVPPERRAQHVGWALGCGAAVVALLLGAGIPVVIYRISESITEPTRSTFVTVTGGAWLLLMVVTLVWSVVRVYRRHR